MTEKIDSPRPQKGGTGIDPKMLTVEENHQVSLAIALKDAERVMAEIDALVRRGLLDSRSGVADARLDYCDPGTSRLEQIQREYPRMPATPKTTEQP